MPAPQASGAYLCTAAEVIVATVAANYVLQLRLDLGTMAAGDIIRVRIYSRIRTGDTDRIVADETFSGVQAAPIWPSIPIGSPFNWYFSLIQTAGTLRTLPYSCDAIAERWPTS